MIPPLIVQEALERGIDIIAITDHNASANVGAVQRAAADTPLIVLPGMEIQTREEVHVLCLFDTLDQVDAWQAQASTHLPQIDNNIDYFGEQFVVDASGDFIRREAQLLITSTDLALKDIVAGVQRLGGIAIPAHVNRNAFSLIANLGFVPPDVHPDALEVSRHLTLADARKKFPQVTSYPLIRSGDVHRLEEFLGANIFTLAAPTIDELRLALRSEEGRSLQVRD
jgi:PHP family Zn ribbon phosphoesterase